MSVYIPQSFAARGEGVARLVREYSSATLVTASGDEPQASHVPLLHRAYFSDAGATAEWMASHAGER